MFMSGASSLSFSRSMLSRISPSPSTLAGGSRCVVAYASVDRVQGGTRSMALLFRVIFSTACSSTHHKLALDALRHLRGPETEAWTNLFLKHYETYLEGSKAPDNTFKDFKNHVLHVG